jgi:fatty-acyl-CoA synthase
MRELSPWQIVRLDRESGEPYSQGNGRCEPCADNEPGELVFMNRLRTGDIVVRDAQGYVRYVDRQPGFFRQDGYNVSTRAVAQALRGAVTVDALGVTHLKLPRYEGQAGFLVAVPGQGFDLRHIELAYERLPAHQRPRFLRLAGELRLNRGLKFDEAAYRLEGIDPGQVSEPLYAYTPAGFVALDSAIWRELQLGTFRF